MLHLSTFANLPSPPTSPLMTDFGSDFSNDGWHPQQQKDLRFVIPALPSRTSAPSTDNLGQKPLPSPESRPSLSVQQNWPYVYSDPTATTQAVSQDSSQDNFPFPNLEEPHESFRSTSEEPQSTINQQCRPSILRTRSDSAASHALGNISEDEVFEEEDDVDLGDADEAGGEQLQRQLTAAELRAQKRKMKRFRLTHNQTRFLMSEFARQAHPDAAHRERLSREIPGLSPRQVQVWFQNRRAKLKRLTSDDRERMMQSRALPEHFDMTNALHSPFVASPHPVGASLASPVDLDGRFHASNEHRPLTLETMPRGRETTQYMSPTGMTPAFGAFSFTPPQSATATLSPVTPSTGEHPPYGYNYVQSPDAHHRPNPFLGSLTSAPGYASNHHHGSRLSFHERFGHSRSESVNSLRTSHPFNGVEATYSIPTGNHEFSQGKSNGLAGTEYGRQRSATVNTPPARSFGINNSYNTLASSFQNSAASRGHSFAATVPRRIDSAAASQYRSPVNRLASTPQTSHFNGYQGQPLVSSPLPAPQASAPFNVTSFPKSYLHDEVHTADDATWGLDSADGHTPVTSSY